MKELLLIFLGSIIVDNLVLTRCLGVETLSDESTSIRQAATVGLNTTGVMIAAIVIVWLTETYILTPLNLWFIRPIIFLLVIAAVVFLGGLRLQEVSPRMVTNSILLGLAFLTVTKGYGLLQSLVYGLGSGLGLTVILVVMAGIEDDLRFADIPESFSGVPITLIVVGLLALSLAGFGGIIKM